MGLPMARCLSSVVEVIAYDKKGNDYDGLKTVHNPSQLGACDTLVTCLPNSDVVEDVLFGNKGLVYILPLGAVIIETSTTSHDGAIQIGNRLAKMGFGFLDAPVSGMPKRAENGTLTMMVGGNNTLFERYRVLLSSKILHVGPVGAGQLAKLINQLLLDINMAALAEILPIAAKLGLDPEQVAQIVNSSTGRSYASEFFVPNILKGVFDQGYSMKAAYKDLIAGAELKTKNGFTTPVLEAATKTYRTALEEGYGGSDKGAMIRVYEQLIGSKFRAKENE